MDPFDVIPVILRPLDQGDSNLSPADRLGRRAAFWHEIRHIFDLYTTEFGYSAGTLLSELVSGVVAESNKAEPQLSSLKQNALNVLRWLEVLAGFVASYPTERANRLYWPTSTASQLLQAFRDGWGANAEECIVDSPSQHFAFLGATQLLETIANLVSLYFVNEASIANAESEKAKLSGILKKMMTSHLGDGQLYNYSLTLDIIERITRVSGISILINTNGIQHTLFRRGKDPFLEIGLEQLLVLIHRALSPGKPKDVSWHPGIAFTSEIKSISEDHSLLTRPPMDLIDSVCDILGWSRTQLILDDIENRMRQELEVGAKLREPYLTYGLRCLDAVRKDKGYLYRPELILRPPLGVHPIVIPWYHQKESPRWESNVCVIEHINTTFYGLPKSYSKEDLDLSLFVIIREFAHRNLLKLLFDFDGEVAREQRLTCPIRDFLLQEGLKTKRIYCPWLREDVSQIPCHYSIGKNELVTSGRKREPHCYNEIALGILKESGLLMESLKKS